MSHLPTYRRVDEPPEMHFTERDGRILETIDRFEGILSDYQIQTLFFNGVSPRTMRDRLMLLYQHGYLERPTKRQRAALPCMVYWLGEQGLTYIAGLRGELAEKGAKPPRWGLVEHDLAVNDVRIAMLSACNGIDATVEEWVTSRDFWAHPDQVSYTVEDGRREIGKVRPDGYCVVVYENRLRGRLLFEIDRATEDNPRFVREKVIPGIAYIRSDAYRTRFGSNAGRWLVITTSDQRIAHMCQQAERSGWELMLSCFTSPPLSD